MFFAVPSAAVSGKGNFAIGGNASFLPSLQPKQKGKKRGNNSESSLLVLVPSHAFYCGRSPNACSVAC